MSARNVRAATTLGWYVLRRIGQAVFVLWAAFTVSFLILYALPSDPVALMTGGQSNDFTPEQLDQLRQEYGLDRSLFSQYVDKLGDALHGDLGRSLQSGRRVTTLIAESLPATAQITGIALVLAIVVGSTVAIVATASRRRHLSGFLLGLPPLGVAIPSFWIGLLLLQQFSFHWKLVPALGNEGWRSLVLPSITLAIPAGAMIAQVLAKSLRTTLHEPYIDTARAKGATPRRVQVHHAVRNACLPALTIAGVVIGNLLSGSVVVETVFSRTGLGRLTSAAVSAQDVPVVQGLVLLGAAVFVTVNLVVDLLYPLLDPRIAWTPPPLPARKQAAPAVAA